MQKDFSYPVKIADLTSSEKHFKIVADDDQLIELTSILQVEAVRSFEADIFLKPILKTHRLDVWGEVRAELELQSVISLENFTKAYVVPFDYYYDTQATYKDIREMEPTINDDIPDIIENGEIDLVSVAIGQLALEMDDYPRREGEEFHFESEFDEETTIATHPFAVLAKLKK